MPTSARQQEFARRLREGLLIADGAMGTTLSATGHSGAACELLNVEQPDRVRAAHAAFLAAGADLVETNTFQGSSIALGRHKLAARAREFNLAGARLAREAAGERALVAGSIGPTGAILEPYGDLAEADAQASFEGQAAALAEGGVDCFIVETFSAIEEALLAVRAAAATGLPVAASMAFDPNGRTAFGVSPQRAAEKLPEAGAIAVGANCGTVSPLEMVEIVAQFRAATALRLIAQPNAGRPELTPSGLRFPESPEGMAEAAVRFREAGATLIGGCCGTSPAHIRAIAQRLRAS
jgi:methionine synthase I (cobalamin-dependent)